ncbi:hypothetical protein DH2020_028606 [Rehmannia glutinosa]|uniref:Uncharacterized protein n=1 Tax=Rehmannia glutinosa TaxID=99300 RepID=A0ABR0VV55_REHGL
MKGGFSAPGDYIYFKSQVPLHKIPIGSKQWRYYDFGPKVVPPLICLPGTAGTADVYYKQIMSLSMKAEFPSGIMSWFADYVLKPGALLEILGTVFIENNVFEGLVELKSHLRTIFYHIIYKAGLCSIIDGYRVISVDIPRVWNHHEWIQAFEKFLDAIDVHHQKLVDMPNILAASCLPSSILFSFELAGKVALYVGLTPSFLLKRYVLTGIRDGPLEPFIADSVDFVVSQVETLSRDDLASRLSLTVDAASVGPLMLSDSSITIMDTNDFCAIPQQLKDQVTERYPGARQAYLKSGGDFPFLSRPDEVNLHLQLHLRRVGVEAHVPSIPKDDVGGSSSDQNDRRRSTDDAPEDDRTDYSGPSGPTTTSEPPLVPEGQDSGNFENQLLNNAYLSSIIIGECLVPLMLQAILENRQTIAASNAVLNFTCELEMAVERGNNHSSLKMHVVMVKKDDVSETFITHEKSSGV